MTKKAIIGITLTAIVASGMVAGSQRSTHAAGKGETREISRQERKMTRVSDRERRRAVREFKGLQQADIEWGNEKAAKRATVIVLDPPLRRQSGPTQVDVEVFFSFVDNGGGQTGWWTIGSVMGKWMGKMTARRLPVEIRTHHLGHGPYLSPTWNTSRRLYQGLVMGWEPLIFGKGLKANRAFTNLIKLVERGDDKHLIETQKDAEQFMWANWLPLEHWKKSLASPETAQRIRDVNQRWAKVAKQGSKVYAKTFKGLPDPVLLIDGKFLITANTARRHGGKAVENVFLIANWIIRQELKKIPSYGFREETIKWGMERKPKKGELIQLRKPFPAGEGVEIEWLYTYITPDGQSKAVRWVWDTFWNWRDSLKEQGIEVTISKAPIINAEGWIGEHQRVHQEAATAWKPIFGRHRDRIHIALAEYLATSPRGIGNHDAAGKVLQARAQINQHGYHARRTKTMSDTSELAILEAKGKMLQRVRKRNRTAGGPIFLINGEYVLMTKNITDAFQSLNWTVRRLHEG